MLYYLSVVQAHCSYIRSDSDRETYAASKREGKSYQAMIAFFSRNVARLPATGA